jgi:hypothetical protein
VSTVIIGKLATLFAVVAIGWLAGRTAAFRGRAALRLVTDLAFLVFTPALLFRLTATGDLAALPWTVLAVYFGPAVALLLAVHGWQRLRAPRPPAAPSVRAITTTFGNTVQLGRGALRGAADRLERAALRPALRGGRGRDHGRAGRLHAGVRADRVGLAVRARPAVIAGGCQGGPVTFPLLRQTVLECTDARALAEFYRALLGLHYRPGDEPPAPGEPDPRGADWLVLRNPPGPGLAFQQVSELPRSTWPEPGIPQQLHVDTTVPTVAELDRQHARVLELGGTLLLDRSDDPEEPLRVYADLAGHPFCVFVGEPPRD